MTINREQTGRLFRGRAVDFTLGGNSMNPDLAAALDACRKVGKSERNDFSYDWLRKAGYRFHHSLLTALVKLGYLTVEYNGIIRRGTAWYKLAAVTAG